MSQPVDGRTDLYSLGGLLYELCTGLRPIQGENLPSLFRAITQDIPPDPKITNPAIPQALSQIIMKCLEKQPDKRFQTGKALAEALKVCLKKKDPHDSRTAVAQKMKNKPAFRPYFLLAVVFLIILIGGFSYYFMKGAMNSKVKSNKLNSNKEETIDPLPPVVEMIAPAFLKIQSTPLGAQVFVDGMFKGKAPLDLELSAGKHEVRLTLAGYYEWEAQIQLKEESETPLSVRLIPTGDQ